MVDRSLDEVIGQLDGMRRRHAHLIVSAEEELLLTSQVDGGDHNAAFWLGLVYLDSQREREGCDLIERAAGAGVPWAVGEKATMDFWSGWQPDIEPVIEDTIMSAWRTAAEAGDYVAQFMLAQRGDQAREPLSDTECFAMLVQSAEAGYVPALSSLGDHYYHGYHVVQDVARAASLFKEAYDRSDPPSDTAITLAFIYAEGHGLTKDMSKCLGCLQAYAKGLSGGSNARYREEFANACAALGDQYVYGTVIRQSSLERLVKAGFWYGQSIRLGNGCVADRLVAVARRLLGAVDEESWQKVDACVQDLLSRPAPPLGHWLPESKTWPEDLARADEEIARDFDKKTCQLESPAI